MKKKTRSKKQTTRRKKPQPKAQTITITSHVTIDPEIVASMKRTIRAQREYIAENARRLAQYEVLVRQYELEEEARTNAPDDWTCNTEKTQP